MSRPQTPPHEPRYNVHVAPNTIEQLISTAFPGVELLSCAALETNKGYNNRVYFLTVRRGTTTTAGPSAVFRGTDDTVKERELVLKANGRFFFADKVQNEVGCLQILRQHCADDIPTPTVLAWSEDGADVTLAEPAGGEAKQLTLSIAEADRRHGGWILMSRLPGTPLSARDDLDEAARLDIMRQLAGLAARWRTDVPAQRYLGNMQFYRPAVHDAEPDFTITSNAGPQPQDLVVRGILVDELRITTPITSVTQQYTLKMEEKLKELESSDNYARSRHLAPAIRSFITDTLPRLDAIRPDPASSRSFVFTHYDLSPRNILITGSSPPTISGIVDFEFAGFFAPVQEFLNDAVGNEGDWPDALYAAYLTELAAHGIATPVAGIGAAVWDAVHALEHVADNIAPWWLPGPYEGDALEEQFGKSQAELQKNLKKLS